MNQPGLAIWKAEHTVAETDTMVIWIAGLIIVAVVVYDLVQTRHAILHNFPIIGHFRYWLEAVGPELRQYIVTDNDEERPFSRNERRWVYASAKRENNYFGFGTDNDVNSPGYLIIKHSSFPPQAENGIPAHDAIYSLPAAKVMGASRGRRKAFRPSSIVNISAMSFGSLSGPAITALNRGAVVAQCLHNTGEGGISPYHKMGGELIWQIGTGYFGCRDAEGRFDMNRLKADVGENPVRAIEIKLSQGAKPGLGGVLPAAKISAEIAAIRGIPMGRDCISPAYHSAFRNVDGLLDFVESIAEETGLPVGIKSAVGESEFWTELADQMERTNRGVDFITIDGGEGGTGAGPLVFADHVAFPFQTGFCRVFKTFARRGLEDRVLFIGSGKLGFPESGLRAFALGCDLINVGREAMLSVGCIQAQRCHTGRCPTGVATQSRWLTRGLDPTSKSARLANYIITLRKELIQLSIACGFTHPAYVTADHLEILDESYGSRTLAEVMGYEAEWLRPRVDVPTESR